MSANQNEIIHYYEKLPVAVYVCDSNDLLVYYNNEAAVLFDVLPQTGTMDWYPSFQKYDASGRMITVDYRPVTAAIKADTAGKRQEFKFIGQDAAERNILVSSEALWDDRGRYEGAVHTFTDVTMLRQSERQQGLLAAIVRSSQDAIVTKDLNGVITSWNPGAERLFEYTSAEAIGQHISIIIPQSRLAEEQQFLQHIKNGETVEHFETERIRKSGKVFPISITISPVKDLSGIIIGASKIARDITRQKEAEGQLQAYTEHLEDMVAQRTADLNEALREEKELGMLKSRFVSMASHEFRTPLASIKLSATLLGKYTVESNNPQVAKHLQKIENSVSVLSAILTEFLSLEKLESGKVSVSLQTFDLAELCRETVSEMQLLSKPGQQLSYRHEGLMTSVVLDDHLLRNCLHNLLSNAIKYSDENTIIRVSSFISGHDCLIEVTDEGIGIPEADQKYLFGAFFRAGNVGTIQGTGLGLNIVARYAALMGGSVSCKSAPVAGTTFKLYFPLNAV